MKTGNRSGVWEEDSGAWQNGDRSREFEDRQHDKDLSNLRGYEVKERKRNVMNRDHGRMVNMATEDRIPH